MIRGGCVVVRWSVFLMALGLCHIMAAQLTAAATDTVQKHITDLSSPNVITRSQACQALGNVSTKDRDKAVDALVGALDDIAGTVRLAALMALETIGPDAKKAIPRILECYQKETVSRSAIIKALGRIGPDDPKVIDFLIEVVRGGRSGAVRPLNTSKPPRALREEAIQTLEKLDPKPIKAIPVLLDVLNIAAADLVHYQYTFSKTADALSVSGVGDKRVAATLKRFQQGKGFKVKGKDSPQLKQAILAADSAVKRMEQGEHENGK